MLLSAKTRLFDPFTARCWRGNTSWSCPPKSCWNIYAEKIEEKTTPSISHNLLELLTLLPNVRLQEIFYNWNLIANDPDDNKFVDCYIAAGADYLVSNDRHFSVLKPDDFPPVQVVRVEEFMEMLLRL